MRIRDETTGEVIDLDEGGAAAVGVVTIHGGARPGVCLHLAPWLYMDRPDLLRRVAADLRAILDRIEQGTGGAS